MNYQDVGRPFKPGDVSDEQISIELNLMVNNPELNTRGSLEKVEGLSLRLVTFQEKHLSYLRKHPNVNPAPYLANLKTMIKIRS